MARRRRPGLRHVFADELEIKAGEITIAICKEAGKVVVYLQSPPEQTTINGKATCKTAAERNNK